MKYLLLTFVLLTGIVSNAQEKKTIYYDANWKVLPDKNNAAFFRKTESDPDLPHHYWVKDYWITGEMMMDAEFSSLDPDVKNGSIKYYFKNGKMKSDGRLQNDRKVGNWTYYYSNGQKNASGPYNNNLKNGEWKRFSLEGVQYLKQTFQDDVLTAIELVDKSKGLYEYYNEMDATGRFNLITSMALKTPDEFKLTEPLIKDNIKFLETCIDQSVFQADFQYTQMWLTACPYAGKLTINLSHFMKDYTTGLEREYNYYPQMGKMYLMGLGKYLLEHNGKIEVIADYHLAGATGMINYYLALRKSDPKAKSKKMDELVDLQKKGKLLSFIQTYQ